MIPMKYDKQMIGKLGDSDFRTRKCEMHNFASSKSMNHVGLVCVDRSHILDVSHNRSVWDGCPTSPVRSKRFPGPSCQALRRAVSSLYRLDDFNRETLGAGFFSEVYKVTHKTTGDIMVLKMNMSQSNRPNMLREVQLMNRLAHPNVLKFMGVCVHEGQLHALTEYINDGTLEQLLANKEVELQWDLRIKLAADIAKGMAYLHGKAIFHRDLTSKNILIKQETNNFRYRYTAIVGDFGLAARIPNPLEEKQKLPIVGSPYWMAPECLTGCYYNEKVDIFSYGIVLCEMISRLEADPDILPRTKNFGIDYVAFTELVEECHCPLNFLNLTFQCCQIEPKNRPEFVDIVKSLDEISSKSLMNSVLKDITKYGVESEDALNKSMLDKILAGRSTRRQRSLATRSHSDPTRAMVTPPNGRRPHGHFAVTPRVVGKVWSKDDDFYTPTVDGFNPFVSHQFGDGCKVVVRDNIMTTLDLPSPVVPLTPPCTPRVGEDSYAARHARSSRRSCSLPGSPSSTRRLYGTHYEVVSPFYANTSYTSPPPQPLQFTSHRCNLEYEYDDDSKSEASSVDSAVELHPRDLRASSMRRKFSIDPSMVDAWQSTLPSRTELIARCMEARARSDWSVSDQWSESCMSQGDSSPSMLMSPCSSLSSYSEYDTDNMSTLMHTHPLSHARLQMELLEARARSREKFQSNLTFWEQKLHNRQHQDQQWGSNRYAGWIPRSIRISQTHDDGSATEERQFHVIRKQFEEKKNHKHNLNGAEQLQLPQIQPQQPLQAPTLKKVTEEQL